MRSGDRAEIPVTQRGRGFDGNLIDVFMLAQTYVWAFLLRGGGRYNYTKPNKYTKCKRYYAKRYGKIMQTTPSWVLGWSMPKCEKSLGKIAFKEKYYKLVKFQLLSILILGCGIIILLFYVSISVYT